MTKREAWGLTIPFAEFSLKNASSVRITFPIEGSDGLLVPHGAYEFLESRSRSSSDPWTMFDPNLDEFSPAAAWVSVDGGAEITILSSVFGPMSVPDRARTQEFRLRLKDAGGCEYVSQPFRLPDESR